LFLVFVGVDFVFINSNLKRYFVIFDVFCFCFVFDFFFLKDIYIKKNQLLKNNYIEILPLYYLCW